MRFFEYIEQIPKILYIIRHFAIKRMYMTKMSLLITKLGQLSFKLFEQLYVLSKFNIFKAKPSEVRKYVWISLLVASISSLLYSISRIRLSYIDERELKDQIQDTMGPRKVLNILEQISDTRRKFIYELFESLGNIVVSMQRIEDIFELKYFHKGLLGSIGFLKSSISVMKVYNSIVTKEQRKRKNKTLEEIKE